MSPELKRNLWLEFTPSRVIIMTGVLSLVGLAVFLISDNRFEPLIPLGVGGYVFITLFWGSRNAARAVIGEIRERTWDFQRISAVTPASMTFGKLLGATSYTWYGGLLSLAIAMPGISRSAFSDEGFLIIGLLIASGVLAHAVAMGSALATARRRRADARLGVLPHQAAGLAAAAAPAWAIGTFGEGQLRIQGISEVTWFGAANSGLTFAAIATAIFAVWAVIGCWREMRLELMETNRPLFWPVFLAFLAVFLAGFGDNIGAQIGAAYFGIHAATMISLLVEPKNAVELRAVGGLISSGNISAALTRLPAYGWAFLATTVLAIAAMVNAPIGVPEGGLVNAWFFLAALGFLARDIGIFMFFHAKAGQKRGDFSALVALALLYVVGNAMAGATHIPVLEALFNPDATGPAWAAVLPWLSAVGVWALATMRLRGARAGVAAPAPAPAEA